MAQVSSIADEQTTTPLSSGKSITLRIARFNPEKDTDTIRTSKLYNLRCTDTKKR